VRDTGIGLSPDMLPKVFQLFAQVHANRTISPGGLGIGLAVVKRLVELHGGEVAVESGGLGQGSTFTVLLPLTAVHAMPAPEQSVVPKLRSGPRALVVDDNQDAADALAVLLRGHGLEVTVARDGAAALELAESIRPDVILLDVGLPHMSGNEVASAIRAKPWGAQIRIIAVTGWGQADDRRRSLAAGFDRHLVKPVDPERLLAVISEGTERAVSAAG
jgi:CheY-like chemotaxis protein